MRVREFLKDNLLFISILISSSLSLLASLVLSQDAIKIAANKSTVLSCNINEVISCGKVASSHQANLLGFPNAFLGLITEPMIIVVSVALISGVIFKRWFMFILQIGYFVGFIFAYWLFYQSMFNIGALCPWCLLITFSTTIVFISFLKYNIKMNNLFLPAKLQNACERFIELGLEYATMVVIVCFLLIAIYLKYGNLLFS